MSALALLPTQSKITLSVKNGARLEFTVALLKIELYNFSEGGGSATFAFYQKLISRIAELISHSSVTLEELRIPMLTKASNTPTAFIIPYLYHAAISSSLVYLKSKAEKLTVRENAISVSKEGGVSLRISARVRIFYVLRTILQIAADKKATDKKPSPKGVARAKKGRQRGSS